MADPEKWKQGVFHLFPIHNYHWLIYLLIFTETGFNSFICLGMKKKHKQFRFNEMAINLFVGCFPPLVLIYIVLNFIFHVFNHISFPFELRVKRFTRCARIKT